jgi:tripartite-type tricarboxylate transporter receptor subunit TctC
VRTPIRAAIAAIALAIASPAAYPQAYPSKPIRFIVPFAPAGPSDIIARLVGQKLPDVLGQPVVVENRTGASGNIGAVAAAKSAPDGYTALVTSSAIVVNVTLFPNAGYDAERDFIPVALVATQPNMVYVHPSVPAKTLDELLALAKTSKLAYASPGSGTTPHLTAEMLFRVLAKVDMTPIHFRGAGPQVVAVVAGEPPVGCGAISGPIAQIKAGKLRPIAVSSSHRLASLPDVPTFAEAGFPSVEDYTWIGVFLPAGTPMDIVHRLNEGVNRVIQGPEFRERLDSVAFEPVGGTQVQFAEYFKAEVVKWGKVVRETGAKPD